SICSPPAIGGEAGKFGDELSLTGRGGGNDTGLANQQGLRIPFVAADRRRVGPGLAVNIQAARAGVRPAPDTRRAGFQMDAVPKQLGVGVNNVEAESGKRIRAAIGQSSRTIVIPCVKIDERIHGNPTEKAAAGSGSISS